MPSDAAPQHQLSTGRLVVLIAEVNAYNHEVLTLLDEEAQPVEKDGDTTTTVRYRVGCCVFIVSARA